MKKRALHNFAEGYFIEGRNVVLEDKFGGTKIGIACVCVCMGDGACACECVCVRIYE